MDGKKSESGNLTGPEKDKLNLHITIFLTEKYICEYIYLTRGHE